MPVAQGNLKLWVGLAGHVITVAGHVITVPHQWTLLRFRSISSYCCSSPTFMHGWVSGAV